MRREKRRRAPGRSTTSRPRREPCRDASSRVLWGPVSQARICDLRSRDCRCRSSERSRSHLVRRPSHRRRSCRRDTGSWTTLACSVLGFRKAGDQVFILDICVRFDDGTGRRSGRRNDDPSVETCSERADFDGLVVGEGLHEVTPVARAHRTDLHAAPLADRTRPQSGCELLETLTAPAAIVADVEQHATFDVRLTPQRHAIDDVLEGIESLAASSDQQSLVVRPHADDGFAGREIARRSYFRREAHLHEQLADELLGTQANRIERRSVERLDVFRRLAARAAFFCRPGRLAALRLAALGAFHLAALRAIHLATLRAIHLTALVWSRLYPTRRAFGFLRRFAASAVSAGIAIAALVLLLLASALRRTLTRRIASFLTAARLGLVSRLTRAALTTLVAAIAAAAPVSASRVSAILGTFLTGRSRITAPIVVGARRFARGHRGTSGNLLGSRLGSFATRAIATSTPSPPARLVIERVVASGHVELFAVEHHALANCRSNLGPARADSEKSAARMMKDVDLDFVAADTEP